MPPLPGFGNITALANSITPNPSAILETLRNWRYHRVMKNGTKHPAKRLTQSVELGEHIVADPEICHGKPAFKGTRIMVWQVLDALARGESSEEIVAAW